jgi:hypothetical protein
VALLERPVLVVGERGTGKELAASRLHYLSRRWERPLVTVNCAALPESLLDSELFGHEAGAFTGAVRSRGFAPGTSEPNPRIPCLPQNVPEYAPYHLSVTGYGPEGRERQAGTQ